MIKFQDISKKYGEKEVLKQISSSIPKGKITSLIGPNGAGKSTLLSIISRLLKQDEGNVTLMDRDISSIKNNEIAKQLSILKQSNNLDLKLTVKDLVSFGRFPYSKGRLTEADWEQVNRALDFSELKELENDYLDELSGGQRQRAFLSMIIAQDTEYVLLDEPLNNLDMKHSVKVMKTLRRLVDELGKTVIIVIHEINFAAQYSDHILAMKDGKIKYNEATNDVIECEKLKDIFGIEFDIIEKENKKICNYFNL
ncbi:iron ABC transporter ATP-binding protein [Sphingobacterium hungaricum]|uniref:Iron ABC transporter ATP-binding protein n=1 Tax=Sphingobacterium hungaricum TaxID=2082723 RepID=A0A928YP64_9SPHI|nr:ATP-binding cassette domain-containing protein [Sphingobacterium hungaricum]MBE8712781.1 iron ABC transporter ATP-binding protein [Sphingobacterium hungaricum]